MVDAFYDVVIVGAGPAGLACAKVTAAKGLRTLVLERKEVVGKKVCAGGITWNGLVKKLNNISERSFATQHIFSKNQSFTVSEYDPIIATVNRKTLGTLMCDNARREGAIVESGYQVIDIKKSKLVCYNKREKNKKRIGFSTLVGADGSSSTVRKHLNIPVQEFGVGINYMVDGHFPQMEWHLDSSLFGSGYAWIFPHGECASVGAYTDAKSISATALKESFHSWAKNRSIDLPSKGLTAERINYDYQGYKFNDIYLAGDAAGLASALTGEGIYPAMISGEAIGREISGQTHGSAAVEMKRLIRNHDKHRKMVKIVRTHPAVATCLSELICFGLKKNIIDFRAAEMAH